jgi:hypothetical protein
MFQMAFEIPEEEVVLYVEQKGIDLGQLLFEMTREVLIEVNRRNVALIQNRPTLIAVGETLVDRE